MRAIITIVVLALLAGLGWYWYQNRGGEQAVQPVPDTGAPTTAESNLRSAPAETIAATPLETQAQAPAVEESPSAQIEREAETFVEELVEVDPEPLSVDNVDHFVSAEQTIALLPSDMIETASAQSLLDDDSLSPETPITVVKEIEQIETISAEKLIAESGGNLSTVVTVMEGDEVVVTTVKDVLEAHAATPQTPISIVKKVRYYQITTPGELRKELDLTVQGEELIGVIRKPYRLEEASIAELLSREKLLDPDAIFYVRTVRSTDSQGIWGIVHAGLISNFSRGVAIRRGQQIDTYQVEIPELADEILDNKMSSFLGRMIFDKTKRSYVYNFREHLMGRNPNELNPGQEIVIIKFSAEELISIYKHFVTTG